MVTGSHRVFECAANFLHDRKCVFCGSFKINRTQRGYVKCRTCSKQKSLAKLRREIVILQGVYQQVPAYRLANDLGVDPKVISRVYQKLRAAVFHVAELEGMARKLSGEIELDEAYFGGRRKGRRGRGAAGKSVVLGLLERDGRVYTKVVEHVSADTLMAHIQTTTRKGSVSYTEAFRGDHSLRRYGKHHTVNHSKSLVDRRTKHHINGIEGFWSFAKHILYNYRGVSKYHFPMYLKEIEYRFTHREENLFKLFLRCFFGYVSP
ncbi:MAG: IS1595 family transposase [Nitrospira sp.]|nr:IS1595 family transposase [Nitrospira sp.]